MNKASKFIYFAICYVFFIFTNLYLSNIMVENLQNGLLVSNPVFSLNYIRNTGAAFSILQDSRELLIILSMIALVLLALHVINFFKNLFFHIFIISRDCGKLTRKNCLRLCSRLFSIKFYKLSCI